MLDQRVTRILLAAAAVADAAQAPAISSEALCTLLTACADDPAVRADLLSLLGEGVALAAQVDARIVRKQMNLAGRGDA